MKTITIQIGNTDNSLTQADWSRFVDAVTVCLLGFQADMHFFGGSVTWAKWQNCCWVFNYGPEKLANLKQAVAEIGTLYQQQSIAWTEGETVFI